VPSTFTRVKRQPAITIIDKLSVGM
ncbi:uncharacterized protein METZ01_LOCUS120686, partial [marine metagenome]